ncbi:cell envelope integrity protein TolA [Rhodoferax sp. U11-2br]|uniref:cell envelope integrity protein TolA n=1 Tax=Rhodoferax sp. U11-2br TaxID=2838878 RepID=UPI001BEBC9E3|nr:cell envelope integrity protein TolA [Rhodoferax sp. U11-2br]MBT3068459.1 cell envelope integrity protein TolA [Rhodoferax sp. U11-2br]
MHVGTDRLEFAPPSPPGMLRALVLALLVHGLLLLGLTWSVRWKHDTPVLSAEAELWSSVPVEAAPQAVEPEPEPAPEPEPQPAPPPKPAPVVEPPAPPPPKVDIALEQEKQRLKKEQARLEELKQEKLREKERLDKLEKARLEKLKQDKLKQEQLKQEQLKQDKLKQDKLKQEKLKAEQAAKAQQTAAEKKQAALDAKQLEAQRQKNLQRMAGLAGASGSANATGTALKSSGPSASYGGRIRAKIKPNIVFTEDIQGNPTTEVEVRAAPDGTIVSRKITKSSGIKDWDEAVIRAIDKTEVLPRDIDGSMPSSLLLVFRPKD